MGRPFCENESKDEVLLICLQRRFMITRFTRSLGKQPHAAAVEVFDEGTESQDEAEIATFYSRLCCHPGLKEVELQCAS